MLSVNSNTLGQQLAFIVGKGDASFSGPEITDVSDLSEVIGDCCFFGPGIAKDVIGEGLYNGMFVVWNHIQQALDIYIPEHWAQA